ncbi:MAG: hypothetical protein JWO94_1526 [Verrucomicrobiaceae bacterium]|nr:hypothetical protein [Verrucomicrobiaceae bacterium]
MISHTPSSRHRLAHALVFTATSLMLASGYSHAGVPVDEKTVQPAAVALGDLDLDNLFSTGWDETWAKHPHPGAPDLSLLRVQNNFLERELRFDYFYQDNLEAAKVANLHFFDTLVAWGLNRRLMLGVIGSGQWNDNRVGESKDGIGGAVLARLALIDKDSSSLAVNARVTAPDHDIGETLTTIAVGPAGWQDLSPFGLPRTGLYWHVQEEGYVGPAAMGTRRNALTYDLSLAKTWSAPDALVGNFSTFVEAFARTDLDGDRSGRSALSLTPGVRLTFDHGKHVVLAGVDIPLGEYRVADATFRLTYIYNF